MDRAFFFGLGKFRKKRRLGNTPLCPAGHLPLKGGDWLTSLSVFFLQRHDWCCASMAG
jgi:hypothetical protein